MPKPILGYWEVRGLVEPIRYLLHYKNVDFEDKRYSLSDRSEWEKDKYNLNLDFPDLPYYIDDDVRLTQSNAILRYLAGKFGLDGNTEEEKIRVFAAEQQIIDLRDHLSRLTLDENFEELKLEFMARVPFQMKLFSDFLGKRTFMVGDSITYVDFMAYEMIDFYHYFMPRFLADFPTLREYKKRILNLPGILRYINSTDFKRWPIYSKNAKFGTRGPEPKQE
ncbi:unnamed protein product [Larinioides sclopetarius]|uniref:glutathione transferase n=1 Tax=Larinioides sclopetarius TaxID=280406 RepID=A0AAV2ANI9_9ARAC